MEFFTIILEKSSSRQVLPDNFVKMMDGHQPQNMKLRQAGNGLRKLWDVEVVFDTDGSMYLDHGWKQFIRVYDLRHGYFLVFRPATGFASCGTWRVAFDTDGSMYLDRGWKQFVRAYDLRHRYFLVFRYDDNATFPMKVFDTTMCQRRYQDDDDASNGSRSSEYCDMCYVYGSSDSGYSKVAATLVQQK
ncbi:hypothetical protein D1007_28842 [Hordeum vulgare]|nr:hypothetical protein D1007_28842 [Hordeum vulgare]